MDFLQAAERRSLKDAHAIPAEPGLQLPGDKEDLGMGPTNSQVSPPHSSGWSPMLGLSPLYV